MTPQHLQARPSPCRQTAYAARYKFREPLDDLVKVAKMQDPECDVVEVQEFAVALVRYWEVPDHQPAYIDYEVVPAGHYLVFSELHDLLFTSDQESLDREWATIDE